MDMNKYLKQLETLVNIDCGSNNHEGIRKVADYLIEWYREIDWNIKIRDTDNDNYKVLEIFNHDDCHYDVMFIGHLDTVFPDGTASKRPFKIVDDICYGPGVDDMKNGVLAMLHLAENLDRDIFDKLNICMCYNPDEEIGSRYSKKVLDEIGSKADRIFVMESSSDEGNGHVFNRKGKVNYVLDFEGIEAHAGYMFETKNASAISKMAEYVVELDKLKDKDRLTSVNVGVVSGGTTVNTVAKYASLEVEIRFKELSEKDRVVNRIESLINDKNFNNEVKVSIRDYSYAPPWNQTKQGLDYIKHVEEIAETMDLRFYEKPRGGLSDANHLSQVCPIVLDGMGPCGSFAHSEKECMYIKSVEPSIELLMRILKDLAQ